MLVRTTNHPTRKRQMREELTVPRSRNESHRRHLMTQIRFPERNHRETSSNRIPQQNQQSSRIHSSQRHHPLTMAVPVRELRRVSQSDVSNSMSALRHLIASSQTTMRDKVQRQIISATTHRNNIPARQTIAHHRVRHHQHPLPPYENTPPAVKHDHTTPAYTNTPNKSTHPNTTTTEKANTREPGKPATP